MHCGVMVTGYNQGDWERLLAEDYSRPPAVSDAANMDDTLHLGELVEPLGFDSIWATEHYGSAYSMQPNPLQYLAYWAGRTARVDVGTAVIVAPWWNPVRLASEISMLDILLKGRRLHLGIGRGISPRVRLARLPDRGIARVLLRRHRSPPGVGRSRALHLRRQGLQDSADHHPPTGAAQR
jgi:alkanesulfonate monooxygenase SsuD/methylene tetrahydromethanopterin reductase-like flavin-dependent oxidoreductase (luciferase family)